MSHDRIPTFGVPDRIGPRLFAFVFVTGIPLTIIYIGVLGALLVEFDLTFDTVHPALALGAFGLGPASAYYLGRWLEEHQIPLLAGCGALILGTVALGLVGILGGWLAVVGLGILSGLVLFRWARRRDARDQRQASEEQGSVTLDTRGDPQ